MTNQTGHFVSEDAGVDPPNVAGSAQRVRRMRRQVVRPGAWKHWVEALRHREAPDEMDAESSLAGQSTSAVALAIEAVRRFDDSPRPAPRAGSVPKVQPPEDSEPPT